MAGFRRVLCPIDFSDGSRRALDLAAAIATWYRGHVWALHVHRISMPVFGAAPFPAPEAVMPLRLTDAERDELETGLRQWVVAETGAPAPITTMLDEDLDVPGAIVNHAQALGADLVTLGTHGRSGFSRFALGSVTEKVIRTADCAVLTVPPHAADAVPRGPDLYQRIMCPVDFSPCSRRALEHASSIAHEAHAPLSAVHIIEIPPDLFDPPRPDLLTDYRAAWFEQARGCMKNLITPFRQVCEIDELLLVGKPYREILRLAAEQQVDLIVMGVQGRGTVDRMLFGSVTEQVVRRATCPVLTVRGSGGHLTTKA